MKHIVYIISVVLIGFAASASNTLSISSLVVDPSDTVLLEVSISNDDPFVSFQFDMQLPTGFQHIDGMAELTGRESDHSLVVSDQGNNRIRFIAFSPLNDEFSGNSGTVLTFKVIASAINGFYSIDFVDAIIGNSNSENILSDIENGSVNVGNVSGIYPKQELKLDVEAYPNPISANSTIRINSAIREEIQIRAFNISGSLLGQLSISSKCIKNSVPVKALIPKNNTGIFILEIRTPNYSKTLKLIQQ